MLVKHFSNVDLRRQWDVGGPRIAECRMSSFQSTEIQRKKPVLILLTGSHCNFQTILVIVILNDLPWINSNARFTTVPLKPLSDKKWGKYCRFLDMEVFNYDLFSCSRNAHGWKKYLICTWSNKAFEDAVVNRALLSLHDGSLEIVPFIYCQCLLV